MTTRTELFRLNGAVERDPAINGWMKEHAGELGAIAQKWFEVMRKCGDEVRELLHDGCPTACLGDAAFGYVRDIRYVGKETDRKWEEGDGISVLEFAATEYGRKGKVIAREEVKAAIQNIGINRCARESGFDRKNFVRRLVRGLPVKRNSYNEFARWLGGHNSATQSDESSQ